VGLFFVRQRDLVALAAILSRSDFSDWKARCWLLLAFSPSLPDGLDMPFVPGLMNPVSAWNVRY